MNSNESSSSSMELEQQFHDLEKRYVSLKNEYDLCRAENTAHAGEWQTVMALQKMWWTAVVVAAHEIQA